MCRNLEQCLACWKTETDISITFVRVYPWPNPAPDPFLHATQLNFVVVVVFQFWQNVTRTCVCVACSGDQSPASADAVIQTEDFPASQGNLTFFVPPNTLNGKMCTRRVRTKSTSCESESTDVEEVTYQWPSRESRFRARREKLHCPTL